MADPAATSWITEGGIVAGAIGTAALAIVGKIIGDAIGRRAQHQAERRAVAAALAGEIGGYLLNLKPEIVVPAYRSMAALDRETRLRRLAAFPPLPTGHPAYDKLADKTGVLGPDVTREISRFYNIITGMRLIMGNFSAPAFLATDDEYQKNMILYVTKTVEDDLSSTRGLVRQLEQIAGLRATPQGHPGQAAATIPRIG